MFRNAIITVLTCLNFVSCERRSDVQIANQENILIVGNSGEPKGLDPHLVSGVLESNIIRALFEGLCVEDPDKDSSSLPGVAKKWTPNEDSTEWIFELNPEAKWSDGVPVTAHDFVFSYRRLLSPDPDWPAEYAEMLYFLKNGEAYHRSHFGNILCGNDPDFPIKWEILKESNFKGDPKLKLSNFTGKIFSELEERDRKKFTPYLDRVLKVDLTKLSAKKVETEKLTEVEKRIFFNSKGIDKLNQDDLKLLKQNTSLLNWVDQVPEEVRQLVLDRIIEHHEAGKPNLWEKAEVGVTAIDNFTLKINLRGPIPFLPEITKHYTWYPVPKHVILKHGKINTAYQSPWTRVENIVSNGAFKLKTWRTNHFLEIERNNHYWYGDNVHLNGFR